MAQRSDTQIPVTLDGHTQLIAIPQGIADMLRALEDLWQADGHLVRVTMDALGDIRMVLPDGWRCSPLAWLAMNTHDEVADDDVCGLAEAMGVDTTECYAVLCAAWGALDNPRRGTTNLIMLAVRQAMLGMFGIEERTT